MAFYKIASVPIVGTYVASKNSKFSKCAHMNEDITKEQDQRITSSINLISKQVLNAVAKVYNISDSVEDYIFPIPRNVTADVPNDNGDRFTHEELTRFSPQHKCQVFETFKNDPLHVEHVADDPKTARGFLPDVHYIQNDKEKYVVSVAGIDTLKDPDLANGVLTGKINSFSMGCICEAVKCSICGSIATDDESMCEHLIHNKMTHINGKLVFEDCLGVEFQELSVVGTPADPKALTQAILNMNASREKAKEVNDNFSVISSLCSSKDQVEIAKYFKYNMGKLPESMVRLADRLFG